MGWKRYNGCMGFVHRLNQHPYWQNLSQALLIATLNATDLGADAFTLEVQLMAAAIANPFRTSQADGQNRTKVGIGVRNF